MREYYILSLDDSDGDEEVVSDYEMGDFDFTDLWTSQPLSGRFPSTVRLWVSKGKPTDCLGGPLSWLIVSTRLWALIEPLVGRHCQALGYGQKQLPGIMRPGEWRCSSIWGGGHRRRFSCGP